MSDINIDFSRHLLQKLADKLEIEAHSSSPGWEESDIDRATRFAREETMRDIANLIRETLEENAS